MNVAPANNNPPLQVLGIILSSILAFLVIVYLLTKFILPPLYEHAKKGSDKYFTLKFSLALMFFLAWLAGTLYLATIIGSFVAGVIIGADDQVQRKAEELIHPISRWLIPFFFLSVGLRLNLKVITSFTLLGIGLLLAVIAILAKVIGSGLGTFFFTRKSKESLEVGLGMAPRGEVILLLSTELFIIGIFNETLYTLIAIIVLVSSIIVPFFLKLLLKQEEVPEIILIGKNNNNTSKEEST